MSDAKYERKLKTRLEQIEKDYPGYHVVIWFYDNGGTPKFSPRSRWLRRQWEEITSHDTFVNSWHYECHIILEGEFECTHPKMTDSNRRAYIFASVPFDVDKKIYRFPRKSEFKLNSWMRGMESERYLWELSLPASHSSFALQSSLAEAELDVKPPTDQAQQQLLREMHTCQSYEIMDQLEKGVRILDLRCGQWGQLSKGPFLTTTHVDVVLKMCEEFVGRNTFETVLVLLSWSMQSVEIKSAVEAWPEKYHITPLQQPESFEQSMKGLLEGRPRWYTDKEFPKLKEVRGKCVLLRGYSSIDKTFGIDFEATAKTLDSRMTEVDDIDQLIENKWESVEARTTADQSPSVTSLSTTLERDPNTAGYWITPGAASVAMKSKLLGHLGGYTKDVRKWWLFHDYMDEKTAMATVKLNLYGGSQS